MLEITQAKHTNPENLIQECQSSLKLFLQRKEIGFPQLVERINLWQQSHKTGADFAAKFKKLVIVGLGGSSLGTRVIREVFNAHNVFFVDNVDALVFETLIDELGDLKDVAWAFISKSGTTIESLCALELLDQVYKDEGLHLPTNSIVISETKSSSLTEWARKHNVPECEIPLDIGGRFSVLSPVGMFPAAFMGLDLEKFRVGAKRALLDTATVTQTMAQVIQSYGRDEWITLLWSYSSRMKDFGGWFAQLWAESLGKPVTRAGTPAPRVSTPIAAIGASDQHSILQQVMEGTKDKFVIFQRVEEAEGGSLKIKTAQFKETMDLQGRTMGELLKAEALATQEALVANGVSTMTLKTKTLDEETLGYLFMFWQLVVAGLGEYLKIDAFNQPGVEAGKVLAKAKLKK
ncbi:glucose-6-phosphate isomerase [Bdellovibrio sp. SKB1291214]|uniref:glucose-6-phosphate isomerase n=1 Tax=Bdellovibrio sp. SKB1291214 TaxID=1732569 RepID=UPI000B516450|nr:glucose-6-phosphate isomerase [Bdellovibrio sp. SKB1291214]UYL09058.1 glucose-6-phosphate isomerase [Bdellovibrio sp. SKB1291214]